MKSAMIHPTGGLVRAGEFDVPFDVAVVGGGITGVSVAREAAGRGLRTVLVEQDDFGSGTSAATTKYIHGGIRYLEQYDITVVRESLRERRVLALGAPHLVRQTRFIMPAWHWSKPPAALIGAGVGLYDVLSFDRNRSAPPSLRIPHPRWLSKQRLLQAVPWLDATDLQGAWAYHDTLNMHPERLLLAYAKSAAAAGAVLVNHTRADGFLTRADGDRVVVEGLSATDLLTGTHHEIRARVVVNAAGPWIDKVLAPLGRRLGVGVNRSKGVHVLTRPLGGPGRVHDAVFARAKSGRHVIVSPWMGHSFIGPTDTPIGDDPAEVVVDESDVASILESVNSTLGPGEAPLTPDDVLTTTVGVRPLIRRGDDADRGGGTYSASRRHELYHHAERGVLNVWTIGGGKWTTGRATAEQMVDRLVRHELRGTATRPFDSRRAPAFGTFAWAEDAEPFLRAAAAEMVALGLDPATGEHLARLYGTEYARVARLVQADPALAAPVASDGRCRDVLAQAVFAVTDEGARTLADVVDRRLVLGTLGPVTSDELERVGAAVAPLLGWDDTRVRAEVAAELAQRAALESRWRSPKS